VLPSQWLDWGHALDLQQQHWGKGFVLHHQ
jgi:hypothetical protein